MKGILILALAVACATAAQAASTKPVAKHRRLVHAVSVSASRQCGPGCPAGCPAGGTQAPAAVAATYGAPATMSVAARSSCPVSDPSLCPPGCRGSAARMKASAAGGTATLRVASSR